MRVFAVVTNDYDEYTVHGIFTSRKLANLLVRSNTIRKVQIDPYDLDKLSPRIAQGYKAFTVAMDQDGNAEVKSGAFWISDGDDYDESPHVHYDSQVNITEKMEYQLWAKTETQALKIAQNLREKHIESGEWKYIFDYIAQKRKEIE